MVLQEPIVVKTREVEYYRLWPGNGGDSGTWDTDVIKIPYDTPEDKYAEAIQKACESLSWRGDQFPIAVGLYCSLDDADEEAYGIDDWVKDRKDPETGS